MGNTNLLAIFLTGLITGGLTCMAVQGGLLAATLAQSEEERLQEKAKRGNALPIVAFLIAKLIAYTALGFVLGLLGSVFQLSIETRVILLIAVAVFMVGTAFNILDIHPIFRYFIIQPPRFLTRLVRKQSKSQTIFAPALLGPFTDATINITSLGYSPSLFAVKAGSKVTLHLQNTNGAGCQQAFNIPSLGIQKVVPVGSSDTITFTAPSQPQQLAFVCSMGMYKGEIQVL